MFARGNNTLHQETNQGSYIFSGEAGNFHEWEFRTKLRSRGKRGDFYIDAVSRITEGLRGDAFIVAQEVGFEQLCHEGQAAVEGTFETEAQERVPSGIELLIDAMREKLYSYGHACAIPFQQRVPAVGDSKTSRGGARS